MNQWTFSTKFMWNGAKRIIMLPNNLASYNAYYQFDKKINNNAYYKNSNTMEQFLFKKKTMEQ